jgi:branched-chain amino acid transport system permease protein
MSYLGNPASSMRLVLSKLRSAAGITLMICLALAVVASMESGAYILVNTIVTGGMWALMAIGLALVFGVMNIVSFVHGDFFMIGALAAYFVFTPLNSYLSNHPNAVFTAVAPLAAMVSSIACGVAVGILCEWLVFRPLRRRSRAQWVMNSFVITLGISVLLVNGIQLIFGSDFRGIVSYWPYAPVSFSGVYISFDRFFVFILGMLVILCFFGFMKFTTIGQAIRAVSQDETGALMVGININGIQTLTLALSSAFAALAGACLLFMYPAYPSVGLGPLYNSWFIVILAGMGNVGGAAVGAFVVALLQMLTTVYVGEGWDYTIPAAFIIVVLIFKPSGIFGSTVRGVLEQ